MEPLLSLQNLHVTTGEKKILNGLDLELEAGAIEVIMGPNGSGKSTLCQTLLGHPDYQVTKGVIQWQGKDITKLSTDKRARLGMFLSFQYPREIPGVSLAQLTRLAHTTQRVAAGAEPSSPSEFLTELRSHLNRSGLGEQFLERSLNEGASGGERKKMEVLQASLLNPKFMIFDEIDTGVDVDSMRTIAKFIKDDLKKKGNTLVLITHYNRILKYLKPDKVLVLIAGKLVKVGDFKLAEKIEKEGYDKIGSKSQVSSNK